MLYYSWPYQYSKELCLYSGHSERSPPPGAAWSRWCGRGSPRHCAGPASQFYPGALSYYGSSYNGWPDHSLSFHSISCFPSSEETMPRPFPLSECSWWWVLRAEISQSSRCCSPVCIVTMLTRLIGTRPMLGCKLSRGSVFPPLYSDTRNYRNGLLDTSDGSITFLRREQNFVLWGILFSSYGIAKF